jgi:hypothetical protein
MLDPRFRGDDKCIEHPSITDPLHMGFKTYSTRLIKMV